MAIATFGKYQILEQIGHGGFGEVYKGRDPVLNRYVAVKTCSSQDAELRQRFFREAEIAANLQHPNIVTIFDLGYHDETPYLVQEYLSGEDLNRKIRRREPLADATKIGYLRQVATGLGYAHSRGVIHRDVKPANVRVLDDDHIKILDFGIAKLLSEEYGLTRTGMTLGTVGYLPPEQIRGEKVDQRGDLFSFGVLAYELMTYERPFDGESISAILYAIAHTEPAAISSVWPQCPPQLAALIERCLRKDPAERYRRFGGVLAVFETLSRPGALPPPPPPPPPSPPVDAEGPTVVLPPRATAPAVPPAAEPVGGAPQKRRRSRVARVTGIGCLGLVLLGLAGLGLRIARQAGERPPPAPTPDLASQAPADTASLPRDLTPAMPPEAGAVVPEQEDEEVTGAGRQASAEAPPPAPPPPASVPEERADAAERGAPAVSRPPPRPRPFPPPARPPPERPVAPPERAPEPAAEPPRVAETEAPPADPEPVPAPGAELTPPGPPEPAAVIVAFPYGLELGSLGAGGRAYADRDYELEGVPAAFRRLPCLRTRNDDKRAAARLRFTVTREVDVFVAHDRRIRRKPLWLGTFRSTGQVVTVNEGGTEQKRVTYDVFVRGYPAGVVELGPNVGRRTAKKRVSMYLVFVRPR